MSEQEVRDCLEGFLKVQGVPVDDKQVKLVVDCLVLHRNALIEEMRLFKTKRYVDRMVNSLPSDRQSDHDD